MLRSQGTTENYYLPRSTLGIPFLSLFLLRLGCNITTVTATRHGICLMSHISILCTSEPRGLDVYVQDLSYRNAAKIQKRVCQGGYYFQHTIGYSRNVAIEDQLVRIVVVKPQGRQC
ncbi:hypothetical protein IW262DRAFT_1388220 [Armillaria fumosa]|nr:hypothetical protein IW262DRAFT_1388220 [Armillaria fumosa]